MLLVVGFGITRHVSLSGVRGLGRPAPKLGHRWGTAANDFSLFVGSSPDVLLAVGETDQHPNTGNVGRPSPQANRTQFPIKRKVRKKYAKRKEVSRHLRDG